MNLLLLLSALLSALTGIGATARQPQQTAAVVQQASSHAVASVQVSRIERPGQTPAPLVLLAAACAIRAVVLPAGVPLYLARRRE